LLAAVATEQEGVVLAQGLEMGVVLVQELETGLEMGEPLCPGKCHMSAGRSA